MKTTVPQQLSYELMNHLQGERFILLSTVDMDQAPNVSAISWVRAINETTIRIALASNSRLIENITQNPNVVLTVFYDEQVYSISGEAKIVEKVMKDVAIPLSKVELNINAVRESMFWGAKLIQTPQYVKTYNEEKAKKLDQEVYQSLIQS